MTNSETPITTLIEKAGDYARTSIDLLKLQVIGKSSDILSSFVSKLVIAIAVLMFALTITIGLALWIGKLLGEYYFGFFIMAGTYAIIGLLIYSFKNKWIKEPVRNELIIQMRQ